MNNWTTKRNKRGIWIRSTDCCWRYVAHIYYFFGWCWSEFEENSKGNKNKKGNYFCNYIEKGYGGRFKVVEVIWWLGDGDDGGWVKGKVMVKEEGEGINGVGAVKWHCYAASTSSKYQAMWDGVRYGGGPNGGRIFLYQFYNIGDFDG